MFKNSSSVNNKRTLECREGMAGSCRVTVSHILSNTSILSQLQSWFSAGSRYRVLMTQNWEIYSWKNILFVDQKLQFIIPRPPWRTSKVQPSKHNIQRFKTWNFFTFFYICGSILSFVDSDPGDRNPCGSMQIRIHNCFFRLYAIAKITTRILHV